MKDLSGCPRTDKDIMEARNAIEKSLIDPKDLNPILIYYPTIIEALNELLMRRKQAEVTNRIYDRSVIV
jgi:hypothetical protein